MFELSKWYFDCVSDNGDAAILYRASVRWGLLNLNYASLLYLPEQGKPVSLDTLRPATSPVTGDRRVSWQCPRIGVSGDWSIRSPGIRCALLDEHGGHIRWHCVSPGSGVKIRAGDLRIEGSGYVDYLDMTVKPWQLPFSELKWGRFIGQSESLVWIEWSGALQRRWLWRNGMRVSNFRLGEAGIELPDEGIVLSFDNESILRSDSLDSTLSAPVRALTKLIPRWKSAHETKWLARGRLSCDGLDSDGWVIHELVRWQ